MRMLATAVLALILFAPFATAQDLNITTNVTTVEDCINALADAEQKMDSLKRVYFLFTLLFALLLMTIAFSAAYIIMMRIRLKRLEEIEAYEAISKAERQERRLMRKKTKQKEGKKKEKTGLIGRIFGMYKKETKKKGGKRKPSKRRSKSRKTRRGQTVTVKVQIERSKSKKKVKK